MSELVLGAVAFVGWITAGLALGLWFGERGRRMDAQLMRQGRPVGPPPKPAKVVPPGGGVGSSEAEIAEPPERFIHDFMADAGCSREDAEAEWMRLLVASQGDKAQPW